MGMTEQMWRDEVLAALLMIHGTLEEIKQMMENDSAAGNEAEADSAQADNRFEPDSPD
jgi:hypothetical protein